MRCSISVLVLVLSSLAVAATPVGSVSPPDSCVFDPAFGASGYGVTEAPNDSYSLDRIALDRQGRVYTISNVVIDGDHVLDRVRRFTIDGRIDRSWGTSGHVDLPGRMYSITGRALAVDDSGRLWVVRNSYSDVRQVIRLTAGGSLDPAFEPIEFFYPENTFGPLGDMQPDGNGVVMGFTVRVNGGSGIQFVRISSTGEVTQHDFSRGVQGFDVFVSKVDPSGWVAGHMVRLFGEEPRPRPMVWRSSPTNQPYFFMHERTGVYTSLIERDGVVTAFGTFDSGTTGLIGPGTAFRFGPAIPPYFGAEGGFGDGSEGVESAESLLPLAAFADGSVMGLSGPSRGAAVFLGHVDESGELVSTNTLRGVGDGFFPAASTVRNDGSRVLAGYRAAGVDQVFVVGTTPELGPPVSGQALEDQIARLYEAYYLRTPDVQGLGFWTDQRARGVTLASISDRFAAAPEFDDLYGTIDDRAFVELIYRNVLGRPGEGIGVDFWTGELESGARTRGEVMLEFSESDENLVRTGTVAPHDVASGSVHRLYSAYFGRAPDAGGSCFWVRRMAGGVSLQQVSSSFAASQEFAETYGSLNDREFVELVYSNVLGRPGERSGVDFWTDELENGRMNRGQVMLGFSESPEYVRRTGTLPGS